MSDIATLKQSIETRVAAILGSNYSELAYTLDIEKNSFKGNELRYGVIAEDLQEIPGAIGAVTYNQVFTVILTDIFMSPIADDSDKQSTAINLVERGQLIYKDLVNTKVGSSTIVINVSDLSIPKPVFIDTSNVVYIEMSFTVLYRKSL